MKETVFEVPKMDCPSEERLIRMALDPVTSVKKLEFDLAARKLTVTHEGESDPVLARLVPLNFGAKISGSRTLTDAEESIAAQPGANAAEELSVLKTVFFINAAMFLAEFGLGWVAQSTGLIADSLDMFADAAVFALSILAVRKTMAHKKRAARLSGMLQLALAIGVFSEVVRRFFHGSEPAAPIMITVSLVALAANSFCMWILAKHRNGEAHMQASWIFLTTDVIANAAVVVAGILVKITGSPIPDLVTGALITCIVFAGSFKILKIAGA